MDGFYVETRADGFPWTKEGCNEYGKRGGRWGFIPYPSEAEAQAAIDARKSDRTKFDDPMWGTAEYRIIPARGRK